MDTPKRASHDDDNGEHDYVAASQSTADFISSIEPLQEAKRRRRRWNIALGVLLFIVAVGATGYFGYRYITKPVEVPGQAAETATSSEEVTDANDTSLQEFSSRALGLSLEYPDDWTVEEMPDQLVLTSAILPLPGATGGTVDGTVVLTILQNNDTLAGFDASRRALAVLDSQKIAYSSPSPNQRAETYLSFVSLTNPNAIDAIYITGDKGYQEGAGITQADILAVDPTVELRFYECPDAACATETARLLAIDPASWQTDRNLQTVQQVIRSLTIN